MRRITLPVLLLCLASTACAASNESSTTQQGAVQVVELVAEYLSEDGDVLWLDVHISSLLAKATLIGRDVQGNRFGSVAPYGKSVREVGGTYPVPLSEALQQENATAHVELSLEGDEVCPPMVDELRDMRLIMVPVDP